MDEDAELIDEILDRGEAWMRSRDRAPRGHDGDELDDYLAARLSRRLKQAHVARAEGRTAYLEHGRTPIRTA